MAYVMASMYLTKLPLKFGNDADSSSGGECLLRRYPQLLSGKGCGEVVILDTGRA